jgi:hypothetical protein
MSSMTLSQLVACLEEADELLKAYGRRKGQAKMRGMYPFQAVSLTAISDKRDRNRIAVAFAHKESRAWSGLDATDNRKYYDICVRRTDDVERELKIKLGDHKIPLANIEGRLSEIIAELRKLQ